MWFDCISLMIRDSEHLFMHLVDIYTSSLEKGLLTCFAQFLIKLLVFFHLSCVSSLYILGLAPYSIYGLQIFSPDLWAISPLCHFFCFVESFQFHAISFVYYFFCYLCLWSPIAEVIAQINILQLPLCFLLVALQFQV